MNNDMNSAVATMKPGDRRIIFEQRVVLVEASESSDDFKEKSLRYITLATKCQGVHPNDVADTISKVIL